MKTLFKSRLPRSLTNTAASSPNSLGGGGGRSAIYRHTFRHYKTHIFYNHIAVRFQRAFQNFKQFLIEVCPLNHKHAQYGCGND
ncbi:unnamed protein product [Acanthoscelides obtectus]|uniref:Uncharacterized protein n=1 Tax=Acanthoscelides obtectus TaxID=200917 RepID=A0A9P0LVY8_ACAOB|nr:unnamed protein product [Acanthoscelides obtectus]CAK1649435.1 hypothetical protein AOBTE_LOCUS16238 [Acanthoscelides obtectus]